MILYGGLASPYVARVVLFARLKGLALEPRMTEGGIKSPEYLALNPMGKMPVLDADGTIVPESEVISEFLEDLYPGTGGLPGGLADRARARLVSRVHDVYVYPHATDCGRWAIAFNGEIYNFRELRAELEADGARFRTTSDTEVLLVLFARQGVKAVERLRGMFAFAVWDRKRKELTLARDRVGIKPLVYAELPDGGIAFASEIAALESHPGVDRSIDRTAISAYLACLYVPAPRTARCGIRKLPPGHTLVARRTDDDRALLAAGVPRQPRADGRRVDAGRAGEMPFLSSFTGWSLAWVAATRGRSAPR